MTDRDEGHLKSQAKKIKDAYDDEVAEHEEAIERALQRRDEKIRDLYAQGWRQADLIRAFGYTRETIRQALNPEIRAQLKDRRAARRKSE